MLKIYLNNLFNFFCVINDSETFENSFSMAYEASAWAELSPVTDLNNLILFSVVLFGLSFFGLIFNYQNNLIIFMLFIELMLFSLSFMSIVFSLLWVSPEGQVFALYIMSIAVAESAIGLGLLIVIFRVNQRIELSSFSYLRG